MSAHDHGGRDGLSRHPWEIWSVTRLRATTEVTSACTDLITEWTARHLRTGSGLAGVTGTFAHSAWTYARWRMTSGRTTGRSGIPSVWSGCLAAGARAVCHPSAHGPALCTPARSQYRSRALTLLQHILYRTGTHRLAMRRCDRDDRVQLLMVSAYNTMARGTMRLADRMLRRIRRVLHNDFLPRVMPGAPVHWRYWTADASTPTAAVLRAECPLCQEYPVEVRIQTVMDVGFITACRFAALCAHGVLHVCQPSVGATHPRRPDAMPILSQARAHNDIHGGHRGVHARPQPGHGT